MKKSEFGVYEKTTTRKKFNRVSQEKEKTSLVNEKRI